MKAHLYRITHTTEPSVVAVAAVDHGHCTVEVCDLFDEAAREAALFLAGYETALEHMGLSRRDPCLDDGPPLV